MVKRAAPLVLLFVLVGCREDFAPSRDVIVGTWELQSIGGVPDCTLVDGGELEIDQDKNGEFSGDFEFTRDCPMEAEPMITESATLSSLDVEISDSEYSLELELMQPTTAMLDWECSLDEPDLECTESGDTVRLFDFRREP